MTSPLIEPALSGLALADEIRRTQPSIGEIAIWWLGQSGFLIKSRSRTLIIDPYLSESLTRKYQHTAKPHIRMTRCPIAPEALTMVDWILCSHKHSDHLDPETAPAVLNASPRARLIAPAALEEHLAALKIDLSRTVGMIAEQTVEDEGVKITAIPSAHETLETDDWGRHLYLGFLLEIDGIRLYHSGDTMRYDGLAERLTRDRNAWRFDALFLPINGRDPARGVAGNMSSRDAIELASQVRPRHLIPHHYDMFTFNTASVAEFETLARRELPAEVEPRVPRCGELWRLRSALDSERS